MQRRERRELREQRVEARLPLGSRACELQSAQQHDTRCGRVEAGRRAARQACSCTRRGSGNGCRKEAQQRAIRCLRERRVRDLKWPAELRRTPWLIRGLCSRVTFAVCAWNAVGRRGSQALALAGDSFHLRCLVGPALEGIAATRTQRCGCRRGLPAARHLVP